MAKSWTDLPPELQIKIFEHIFVRIRVHYEPYYEDISDSSQPLALMLVSKSFACRENINKAMFSEASLIFHPASLLRELISSSHTSPEVLSWVRRIELIPSVYDSNIGLSEMESMFPNLMHVHVFAEDLDKETSPMMRIGGSSKLEPLLRTATRDFYNEFVNDSSPDPSTLLVLEETRRLARPSFELEFEYENKTISRRHAEETISRALSREAYRDGDRDTVPSGIWLSGLVRDGAGDNAKTEVTLAWTLGIYGTHVANGAHEPFHHDIKPMFFSTKDMCMRFLVKDAEVVIPQRLTEHMLKPEDLSLVQDDTGSEDEETYQT